MKSLSREECPAAAANFGFTISGEEDGGKCLWRNQHYEFGYDIKFEKRPAHRLHQLAKTIAGLFDPFDQCLFWINEYGIWPSSESHYLFERLRSSYGETRKLHEAPGLLFSTGEIDDLQIFVHLSMLFGWGGYLMAARKSKADCCAYICHDGWLAIGSNEDLLSAVGKVLEE